MSIQDRLQQRRWRSLPDQAVVSLLVAAEHFEQGVAPVWERHGITAGQYHALRLPRGGARVRNPDDRRESIATITKAGLALLDRVDPEVHAAQAALTASLGERD